MTDEEREILINTALAEFIAKPTQQNQNALCGLVRRRSCKQVSKMESERGLKLKQEEFKASIGIRNDVGNDVVVGILIAHIQTYMHKSKDDSIEQIEREKILNDFAECMISSGIAIEWAA